MSDYLNEELQIMFESVKAEVMSSEAFDLPIRELSPNRPFTVDKNCSIKDAINHMQEKRFGSILIVDSEEKVVGIFTERDVLNKVVGKLDSKGMETSITEVMTEDPLCLTIEDEIAYVMNNMYIGNYRHIPIVSASGKAKGIVSIKDVLNFVLGQFPDKVAGMVGEPKRWFANLDGG